MKRLAAMALAPALLCAAPADARIVGACRFDTAGMAFAGTPTQQAACLLRKVAKWGNVAPQPAALPPTLAATVGTRSSIDIQKLRAHLSSSGVTEASLGGLTGPVSRTSAGLRARYFVIHDTSTPYLGNDPFPADVDNSPLVNRLSGHGGANAVAHIFLNRRGELLIGHDFSVPWRATKLETDVIGTPARGLFLHIESVQPRRRDPAGGARNDAIAPNPGFSQLQYDRLALLYAVASLRAGEWLIPAFHAALDEGVPGGHDDPQNFELDRLDAALAALMARIS